jgi:hypothetical protein
MKKLPPLFIAAALCVGTAGLANADASRAQISDQRYHGAKYSAGYRGHVLANCPREYREIYRGDLYCRKPEYQVIAPRHPACPPDVWGMYRGNLYCVGRR